MLIRYGYEITINCGQPTALVCLLSINEDRGPIPRARMTFTTPGADARPITTCSAISAAAWSRRPAT